MPVPGGRRLALSTAAALALANIRYWVHVAPLLHRQLERWERRAAAIPDSELRTLALEKLRAERFNAEAAGMLATLAPAVHREHAAQAIVALEVLFDYLDGLTERPSADPLAEGERLFTAFTDAVDPSARGGREHAPAGPADDGGYLEDLSATARSALAKLPGLVAVAPVAQTSAARAAQAQIRMHAVPKLGSVQLQAWAEREAHGTGLEWRELAAGAAASVLALHALIAAAANTQSTPQQAQQMAEAYLSICVLVTLLDGLVDREQDRAVGEPGYIGLYEDQDLLADTLADVAQRAVRQARELPNGAHHLAILSGVIAYYSTAPGASRGPAQSVMSRLQRELSPLVSPALAVMRTWRLARALRSRRRPTGAASEHEG